MSVELLLTETQARGCPLADSRLRLSEIVDDYAEPEWAASVRPADLEEVLLAPAPVHCELPRRGHEPVVAVWGYARCSLAVFGRQVAATSAALGIEPQVSPEQRPSVDVALAYAGMTWTSKRLEHCASVADSFLRDAHLAADVQPRALNLRLLTVARSNEALRELTSAVEREGGSRHAGQLPQTPAVSGRVVLVNDPGWAPDGVPPDVLGELSLEIDGRPVTLRARTALRRMPGADAPYLIVAACGGPFDDGAAAALETLLRRSLEHALAHHWLATRAEQLNDRQAECVSELLDEHTSLPRLEKLRRDLGLLRYAFVNEIELTWSFEVDRLQGADALYTSIDRAARLTYRWRRELTRFERLGSILATISTMGFVRASDPIQLPEVIPVFSNEKNPFAQVKLWWRYRGQRHRAVSGGVAHGVSVLQRPGAPRSDDAPPGAKKIELHPFRNRHALFAELKASIGLTSFMTAASAVFLGVILQKGQHGTLPMDVLFLFIATFGFLFATLIYANASGGLARYGTFEHETHVEIANRVSEYLGVFPLLVAIPVSVARFVRTGPIPWAVAALALMAMIAYHYLHGTSLLERDISDDRVGSDWQRKVVFVPVLVLLMAATFLGELLGVGALEVVGGVGFSLACLLILLLSAMFPVRTNPQGYLVDEWDALCDETPSFFAPRDADALVAEETRRNL